MSKQMNKWTESRRKFCSQKTLGHCFVGWALFGAQEGEGLGLFPAGRALTALLGDKISTQVGGLPCR